MLELVRFYLLHKNTHVRQSRNRAASVIVISLLFGYGFGAVALFSWALKGFHGLELPTIALGLVTAATLVSHYLLPRAVRVHRVLEKYQDPLIYQNDLFTKCDQDVSTALLYDAYGKTDRAIANLKVALELNPRNAPALHLLRMIGERDGTMSGGEIAP